jgi:hypothetical protein
MIVRSTVLVCIALGVSAAGCADDETTNTDLAYVVGFCSAASMFQQESSVLKPEGAWTTAVIVDLGDVYGSWADALHDLEPPSDIESFHIVLIDKVREAAGQLAQGASPDQATFRLGLLEFPEDAAERLSDVADDVEACATAHYRFDTPIGMI